MIFGDIFCFDWHGTRKLSVRWTLSGWGKYELHGTWDFPKPLNRAVEIYLNEWVKIQLFPYPRVTQEKQYQRFETGLFIRSNAIPVVCGQGKPDIVRPSTWLIRADDFDTIHLLSVDSVFFFTTEHTTTAQNLAYYVPKDRYTFSAKFAFAIESATTSPYQPSSQSPTPGQAISPHHMSGK
jgi:hypothetical protein